MTPPPSIPAPSTTRRIAPRAFDVRTGQESDYPSITRLSEKVYGVRRSIESIRWLYDANPAGPCRLWLAVDRASNEVVALRPVFPWRARVSGQNVSVGQAGDAMTDPDFRGQGLFSALVQTAWSELRDEGMPFAFSFSNPGSLSVYRKITIGNGVRAGSHVVLQFRRMVFPLSLRLVRDRIKGLDVWSGGLDVAYRAYRRWRWTLPRSLSIAPVTRFDSEWDDLWARTADRYGVLTVRDSRYLNWRFVDPPEGRFQVLGLRAYGTLVGYVAFEVDAQGDGCIADLFGPPELDIVTALLGASLNVMLDRGCIKATLWTAAEGRLFPLVRRFGFLPRAESFPMAVHVFNDGPAAQVALDPGQWLAWFGDRDVEHLVARPLAQ